VREDGDVILDTTILGGEGRCRIEHQVCASADQVTANIRIARCQRRRVADVLREGSAVAQLNSVDTAARNSVVATSVG
jgi:hypothetical protein